MLIIILTSASLAFAKTKVMAFDNPGSKRLLKSDQGNYYYFRSLPEKSMRLNVAGLSKLELRSFSTEAMKKPQVISIIGKKQTTHDLVFKEKVGDFHVYESVFIPIPEKTQSIEVLCYDRELYFRAFHEVTPKPKPPRKKTPALLVNEHSGIMTVSHNSTQSDYYGFTPAQEMRFTLSNGRQADLYVRARLLDRSVPVFELWANGVFVGSYEFTLKRTSTYSVVGINHLSIGKKVTLPQNNASTVYELRAKSDHLFLARPVLLKKE
jgi:hypothetical protein